MADFDIFNPPVSVIANGLEGKVILIYGSNNLGKSYQATRFPKPFVIAAEMGLNGIDGIPYAPVTNWSGFRNIVKQFTSPATKEQARQRYSTIIIDEVYATSIYCQDYICQNYGNGALTMADGDSKHNLYQLYEKEYFRQINLLTSAGFTLVFIAHQQVNTQTGFISPKGDKRCINPIVDKCDYVVYLKSNGVDENGRVIKSSAYLAETKEFFARARIEYTPTFIKEFTAENLEAAIQEGIRKKSEIDGATTVSFEQQQNQNTGSELNFESLVAQFNSIVSSIPGFDDPSGVTEAGINFRKSWMPKITKLVESYLGPGKKVSECNENQVEAIAMIVDDLKDLVSKM